MNKVVIFEVLQRVLLYVGLLWYPFSCFKESKALDPRTHQSQKCFTRKSSFPGVFWISWGLCSSILSSVINVFSSHCAYACILQRWQSTQRKPGFVKKTLFYIYIYIFRCETDNGIFNAEGCYCYYWILRANRKKPKPPSPNVQRSTVLHSCLKVVLLFLPNLGRAEWHRNKVLFHGRV